MKKVELLASVASLIALNSGDIPSAKALSFNVPITVSGSSNPNPPTVLTVCATGGAQYTTINAAIRAPSVVANYSQTFDVQICPGTYSGGGIVDFNGTIEGMGTSPAQTVVDTPSDGATLFKLGAVATPFPGVNLVVKNLTLDGTIVATGKKNGFCVQTQAIGVIQIDNNIIRNCQDGILGDPWTDHLNAGVLLIEGNTFNNNCSDSGPSHSIYEAPGTLIVGGPSSGVITVNGTTYPTAPNQFGECAVGYNTKSRAWNTIVQGNTYVQNFTLSSSGAIDIPDGGNTQILDNVMTFGPESGQTLNGVAGVAQGVVIGGLIGQNLPASYVIDRNTIALSGTQAHPFLPVSNLLNEPNTVITNNVFPPAGSLVSSGVLQGLGTISTGNTYSGGGAVTPVVQSAAVSNTTLWPNGDFRGIGGAQSVTLAAAGGPYTTWGGNGVLTVTDNGSDISIGGPGGLVYSQSPTLANIVQTDPGAPSDTLTLNAQNPPSVEAFGTNDVLNLTGLAGNTRVCNGQQGGIINILGGVTTVNYINPARTTTCAYYIASGATLIDLNENISTGVNGGSGFNINGGSTVEIGGLTTRPLINSTDSTVILNHLTIQPFGTVAPMVFSLDAIGGGVTMEPIGVAGGGNFNSVTGWSIGGFESAFTIPTITLNDTVSVPYNMLMYGGAVVYAGIDTVTLAGSTRILGPASQPVTLHVQKAASGTTIGGASPLNAYLDGSGTAKVNATASSPNSTYVEVDTGGSGSLEVTTAWRASGTVVDSCKLGTGVSVSSAGPVSGNYVITFSTGGTVQFDHVIAGPVCR